MASPSSARTTAPSARPRSPTPRRRARGNSADWARSSANEAWSAAAQARNSAADAGKDAAAAAKAATEARTIAVTKQKQETAQWLKEQEEWKKKQAAEEGDDSWIPDFLETGWVQDAADWLGDAADSVASFVDTASEWIGAIAQPEILFGVMELYGSISMMEASVAVIIGGGAICLTGVGCLAGAPAIAVSLAGLGGGAYGAYDGVMRMNRGVEKAVKEVEELQSKGRIAQQRGDRYEDFLHEKLKGLPGEKGRPGFKHETRQYDGRYVDDAGDEIWYEAKSGKYWERINSTPKDMEKFRGNTPDAKRRAEAAGKKYKVISEGPIPDNIKEWLDKKGIEWEIIPQ
ncbi:hypothetical protein [Streptomyces sp. NPDC059176]|uniref:hypothetical protein n=1 Tax=unclassified Streptomyces TaxID=2593676 RepID=UPI0036CB0541